MSTPITDIAIRGLPYVFNPPGLPLVEKSDGVPATTSVLVRGAAGTGKSTLGMAVAHAIAKHHQGIVLCIVTEAALADAAFKAKILGLEEFVCGFEVNGAHAPGSIAAAHLIAHDGDAADRPSEELNKRALVLADRFIRERSENKALTPIRAVLIDSFFVHEEGEPRALGRTELIAFLQIMENQGVSPVLVEEVGEGSSDRLTFPVDLVFTLKFEANPKSGALSRRIVVNKSRYANAQAGPHEMSLDEEYPVIWPGFGALKFSPARAPVDFVMPQGTIEQPGPMISVHRGILLVSDTTSETRSTANALDHAIGTRAITVMLGPSTKIMDGSGKNLGVVEGSLGAAALAWRLRSILSEGDWNVIVFARFGYLLEARGFDDFPTLLMALTDSGFVVCAHGAREEMVRIRGVADLSKNRRIQGASEEAIVPRQRSFRALPMMPDVLVGVGWPLGEDGAELPHEGIVKMNSAMKSMLAGDTAPARGLKPETFLADKTPVAFRLAINAAVLRGRAGLDSTSRRFLRQLKSDDSRILGAMAWALDELGDAHSAACAALAGVDQPVRDVASSVYLGLTSLRFGRGKLPSGYVFPSYALSLRAEVHALAARGEMALAERRLVAGVNEFAVQASVPRLRADMLMASNDASHHLEAKGLYVSLAAQSASSLDTADVLFNIGVIEEERKDSAEAIKMFGQALQKNPFLEMAKIRLSALGIPTS